VARARATSRSVSTPTGWPASTTGTAPQSASRKIITASSTVLNGEQVRGLGVITSAAVVAIGGSVLSGSGPARGRRERARGDPDPQMRPLPQTAGRTGRHGLCTYVREMPVAASAGARRAGRSVGGEEDPRVGPTTQDSRDGPPGGHHVPDP